MGGGRNWVGGSGWVLDLGGRRESGGMKINGVGVRRVEIGTRVYGEGK